MNKKLIYIIAIAIVIVAIGIFSFIPNKTNSIQTAQEESASADSNNLPEEITIDYATYNLLSLVLHELGFLEDEFKSDNVKINWVFSHGGNKSMEFLFSGSADFGSGASFAALVSFTNGNPIKTIYMINTQENSLMVGPESTIKDVSELRGKTIAATTGTNPYIFMVRSLALAGMSLDDINIVNLQHPDGKNELLRGRVDAWAGLEPIQSQAKLAGAEYLYTNPELGSHTVLSVRKEFAEKYPQAVLRVLKTYEKARKWAHDNPDEYLSVIAKKSNITPDVTKLMLEKLRIDAGSSPEIIAKVIIDTSAELKKAGIVREEVDIKQKVYELIDSSYLSQIQQ